MKQYEKSLDGGKTDTLSARIENKLIYKPNQKVM